MTKKCKHCQSDIDAKAKRCPKCQGDLRSWFSKHPIITGLLVLFVLVLVISGGNGSSPKDEESRKTTEEQEAEDFDKSKPYFEDGMHEVGKDIQPGTYRTRKDSSGCYYERLSGFGGTLDEIITNENTNAPAVIAIEETDKGFKSTRCGTWTQDLSSITESTISFDDGIYIVGTDIEPGTYKNSGQEGCYYARLSGFGGTLGDIISNDNTNTITIVTIATTDKGFKSSRCGVWTKK